MLSQFWVPVLPWSPTWQGNPWDKLQQEPVSILLLPWAPCPHHCLRTETPSTLSRTENSQGTNPSGSLKWRLRIVKQGLFFSPPNLNGHKSKLNGCPTYVCTHTASTQVKYSVSSTLDGSHTIPISTHHQNQTLSSHVSFTLFKILCNWNRRLNALLFLLFISTKYCVTLCMCAQSCPTLPPHGL